MPNAKTPPKKAPKKAATKPAAKKSGVPTQRLQEISETYETPIEEVTALYDEMLANEKDTHPTLGEEQQSARAVRRVYLQMKRNSSSGGKMVEGVILGSTDPIDMMAKKRRDAMALFAKSPALAVSKGLTDKEGNPLDARKAFDDGTPNPGFGKKLSKSKFRCITFGLYTWEGNDTPTPMTMFVDAKVGVPPIMQRVKFGASFIKEGSGNQSGIINVGENVKFEVIGPANVKAICDRFMADHASDIANLGEYVAINGDRNTVIIEGDVTQMYLEPDEGKSRSLRVDDDSSLGSRDVQGAAIWLPDHLLVDFAEDSRVIVIGSAKASDRGVSVQAQGVYALPEYKIPLPQEGLDAFSADELEGEEEGEDEEEEEVTEGLPGEFDGETPDDIGETTESDPWG